MSDMSKLTQLCLLMFTSQEMHQIIENEVNYYDPNDHIGMFSTKKWIEITKDGRSYLNQGNEKKDKTTIFSSSRNPNQKLRDKISQLDLAPSKTKKSSNSNKESKNMKLKNSRKFKK